MDSRQAREILSQYRPGDSNSGDPLLAEALSLAQRDADLAIWFGQHCAAQARMDGGPALPMPPPSGTTLPAKKAAQEDRGREINFAALLRVAAVIIVAIFAVIAFHYQRTGENDNFPGYRERMARSVQRTYPMTFISADQAAIREYFTTNGGLGDFTMPRALEQLPAIGGAVLAWHNQPVSLIGLNAGGGTNLFLFFVRRSAFHDLPVPTKTEFTAIGNLMTASWTENGEIYLLAGPNDTAVLQGFLAPPP